MVLCPRDHLGRLKPMDALARFAAKCEFDATTGCVLWRGGTTQGRGNSAVYGSFWDEGRRWFAHRWAGVKIHGLDLTAAQAGHCCPGRPNTLCVQHIEPQTNAENQAERNARLHQTPSERQYWLFVSLGIEPAPGVAVEPDSLPFFTPPDWLRPFLVDATVNSATDAPF